MAVKKESNTDRMMFLEHRMDRLYCEDVDLNERIAMLTPAEQKEYRALYKKEMGHAVGDM